MELKAYILAADDLPREPVPTPEWPEADGKVFVRAITAAEKVAFDQSIDEKLVNFYARAAALFACDGNGHRLFTEEDAAALGGKCGAAVERIAKAGTKLNGMGREGREAVNADFPEGPSGST